MIIKPFTSLATVLLIATVVVSRKVLPHERCTAEGDTVCINCITVGKCVSTAYGFEVEEFDNCFGNEICDDSKEGLLGMCTDTLTESSCICTDRASCVVDPNTDKTLVSCEEGHGIADYVECMEDEEANADMCICDAAMATTEVVATTPGLTAPLAPEERCELDGGSICIDCKTVGTCTQILSDPPTFVVTESGICPDYDICDDEFFYDPLDFGTCITIRGSKCRCTNVDTCILDPNNPEVVLHCEKHATVDPDLERCASNQSPDLDECTCRYSGGSELFFRHLYKNF